MNKILLLLTAFATLSVAGLSGTVSAQEAENAGIGMELGVNHALIDPGGSGDGANSVTFALDFAVTDLMRAGIYREQMDAEDPAVAPFTNLNLTAIQVTFEIHDTFSWGARLGNVTTTASLVNAAVPSAPYAGLYGTVTPFSATTDTFNGAINLNLGYDFLVDNTLDDLLKIGISARISF